MGKGTSIVLGRTGLYRVQVRVCYLVLMGTAGTTLLRQPYGSAIGIKLYHDLTLSSELSTVAEKDQV